MQRCTHCGKVNREGSLFCQDCGQRLSAPDPKTPPAANAATVAGVMCASCHTANPPGMNFCKMCGAPLARVGLQGTSARPSDGAVATTESPRPVTVNRDQGLCPACGKGTPLGFAFCQHCGQRLEDVAARAAERPVVTPTPNLTPPAGMPRSTGTIGTKHALGRPAGEPMSSNDALARTMAPARALDPIQPAHDVRSRSQQAERATPVEPAPEPVVATLVAIRRDGSDGESVPVMGTTFDIGSSDGSLCFADDPYLAQRHVRLMVSDGKVVLRPIDAINGVYIRIRGWCELQPGDQFLVGKELLRYEPLAPEERNPPSLVEHGVRLFGSVQREAWGRLRQLTLAGTTRDLWHMVRAELVLGREEGDITFPDDEFMSRRHAAVKRVGARARLEDFGSSNGTFVRVRGDRELSSGDVLRLGDQLIRFEM